MSFEAEQIQNLKIAIKREFPSLSEQIEINNLLRLVEISENNKELKILSNEEKLEILECVKTKIKKNSKIR